MTDRVNGFDPTATTLTGPKRVKEIGSIVWLHAGLPRSGDERNILEPIASWYLSRLISCIHHAFRWLAGEGCG